MVTCLLCERELEPLECRVTELGVETYEGQGLQIHPPAPDCLVELTNRWGIAIDPDQIAPTPVQGDRRAAAIENCEIVLNRWPLVDDVLSEFFAEYGLARLGGASSGRGWTSFSTFQKCPYLWKTRYVNEHGSGYRPEIVIENPNIAIGSLVHVFLALHYAQMIEGHPYAGLTPDLIYAYALARAQVPFVVEAWRVFTGYRLYYGMERIEPLAVEHNLINPITQESCRFDLVAFFPEDQPMLPAGTYVLEHKTAGRFDKATLEGWPNDGEVIGQIMLWDQLGLKHRFGPLRGVIVNILGKQPKELKFHRTLVGPNSWQIEQHKQDLARWEGLIQLSRATNNFPRARQSCVGRYGMCDLFDHCAGMDV